ncbi:helix-turn-helix domain-containing protein [Litoribacter alkaliphilus]|uniref:Helix-turn-helix domain-containing protein n=1 Tax=Litoribacter ruber TaxID=702568 RepID=A0AAP2G142_9BACT|nr:AraC family transcriptional regulator [Litoribacter alkaliphilus]MBS9523999.1 helix-turn-helix domain-containing protein [Litoribacter alkaliphilus]
MGIENKNKLESEQLVKVSKFKEVIKKTKPHKHAGYYELIFLSEGEGFHWVETENFQVKIPDLYFMKPGQVHHWQFTAVPKGYVVLFKEEFINKITDAPLWSLLNRLPSILRKSVKQEEWNSEIILQEMFAAYKSDSPLKNEMILGYLRVILAYLCNFEETESLTVPDHGGMFDQFQQLLTTHCPQYHQVNQFAEALGTTPQNLNRISRKHSGKSAGELITGQIILEAKRNILHSESNINEIADLLHFNDASYFIKFFKKHVGITPYQFRARHFTHQS